jgi:hypothetical protein
MRSIPPNIATTSDLGIDTPPLYLRTAIPVFWAEKAITPFTLSAELPILLAIDGGIELRGSQDPP